MHIFKFISLFVATVASSGFTIPADHLEGVYQVTYEPDGSAIHTLIGEPFKGTEATLNDVVARNANGGSALRARDGDGVGCGGYGLNHENTNDAVEALKRQCSPAGAVGGGLDFYSIAGDTVAYFCNYNGVAVTCSRDEFTASYTQITGVCGFYNAGWRNLVAGPRNIQIGYEWRDKQFCGRGTFG